MDKTWVLAEQSEGVPSGVVLELLTAARGLSRVVEAVTWGPGVERAAAVLASYGASRIYNLGELGESLAGPKVSGAIAAHLSSADRPDAILFGATYDGRDVAARLSVRLDLPVLTNVVGIDATGEDVSTEHAVFGGSMMLRARFCAEGPGLYVVRTKSFVAEPDPQAPSPQLVAMEVPDTGNTDSARVVARHSEERSGPKLDEAAVVVSGVGASARPRTTRLSPSWPSCCTGPRAPRGRSSTLAGCPTPSRSARPARP